MGVQFGKIIKGKEMSLEDLSGKKIAIDAFNTLFQFLTIIRDRATGQPLMDSKGRITSHLSGLFYRTAKYIEAGIRPIYVFDGAPPDFKAGTVQERRTIREEARWKWREALAVGKVEEALKAAKMSAQLTGEMIEQSKKLLDYMGVPWVQAPSEGEAQCAHMCAQKQVWASASQDWDSILFGSPRLVRNLSITGRRKVPRTGAYYELRPELIESKEVFAQLGVSREQLIIVAMLMGTDFNAGVQGFGPKRALELVKKQKKLENVLKVVEIENAKEVYEFFLNPPVLDVKIEFRQPQPEKILELMVKEHEFARERVEKVIGVLNKAKAGLERWI